MSIPSRVRYEYSYWSQRDALNPGINPNQPATNACSEEHAGSSRPHSRLAGRFPGKTASRGLRQALLIALQGVKMAGQPACALRLAAAPEGGRLAHAGAGGRGCGGPWRGPSVLLSRRQRTRRDIEPLHAVDVQSLAESGLSHAPQVRGSQDCLRACEGRGGMSRYHEPLLLLRMLPSSSL